MSQLRKSSSFRSRIPVRRRQQAQRRLFRPRFGIEEDSEYSYYADHSFKLRTNKSYAFENQQRSNSQKHLPFSQNKTNCSCCTSDRLYSSSYSSGDESSESEILHQTSKKHYSSIPADDLMYVSTDAISLDGLLDAVSCGSNFSSPPSPVQYQNVQCPLSIRGTSYESLEKYNIPLENFALVDDLTQIKNTITSSVSQTNCNGENRKKLVDYCNVPHRTMSSDGTIETNVADELKHGYSEKHKQLSDWYYIKSKNAVVEKSKKLHNVKENINTPFDISNIPHKCNEITERVRQKPNLVFSNQAQSLPRPSSRASGCVPKKSIKWNNFNITSRTADTTTDIDGASDNPSDIIKQAIGGRERSVGSTEPHNYEINTSLPREYSNTNRDKIISPPYCEPPDYNKCHNWLIDSNDSTQHQTPSSQCNTTEMCTARKMNVKQLKEQYQQQQQTKQQALYVNASAASHIEHRTNNKNKVGLQLRHWENIGNSSSQQKANDCLILLSCQQQKQQQPHKSLQNNCGNCNSNNSADENITFTCTKNSSDGIKRQYENVENNLQQQQHPDSPLHVIPTPIHHSTHQEHHPLMRNMQKSPTHQELDTGINGTSPIASTRRFVAPLTATPRPALRSKLIQKRPNDISCSSFEQLNIVGIPMNTNINPGFDHNSEIGVQSLKLSPIDKDHLISGDGDDNLAVLKANNKFCSINTATIQHQRCNFDAIKDDGDEFQCGTATRLSDACVEHTVLSFETLTQQKERQVQMQLQQNPLTRQLFGVVQDDIFQPKTTLYRQDCEISGSYASLECPSPPGPPICLPESQRDPQARLSNYLRNLYQELAFKEPLIPTWAIHIPPGTLCSARLEPDLRLNSNSHGFSDSVTVDQLLVSLQTKDGSFLEAPRRCLIECPPWASRDSLCLRILHAWAKEPPWPQKGTPVALTLFIPLRELKRSFSNYVEKELLPKGHLNPFASGTGGFTTAWNSLEALGPKLLIILDGYCSQKVGNSVANGLATQRKCKPGAFIGSGTGKHHYPSDVYDLFDGKLFPEARVIMTTYTTSCIELIPLVQRHLVYEGLTWGRSVSILDGGQWSGPSRLLDTIHESVHLRNAVRTPLGCLAIATIYHTSNNDLPVEELDVTDSILHCVAPDASAAIISELGRLALFCLKMKRTLISMAEVKMYCSAPDNILGCLDKNFLYGKSAKKKAEYVFNAICPGMIELLAANYIASLASRPGLLAAEITGMAIGDEVEPELLKVLKFAMNLLGEQAHTLLSRLTPLWLTPQIVFSLALSGGHNEPNLAALCDILGISKHPPISPLETKPLWVQVRSVPTDLMGWGMALKSPTCTLKNLEVIYQLEKQNLLESRKAIDIFLESIALNESVSTLRLSSLIEMDVKDSEISYLATCVSKLLLKPRLENFEIVLTLIEEDPPMLKLQAVIAALSRTIPRQTKLVSLLLDVGLSTSQLVQLCCALEKCPNITRLSLPHLRCERGAISALSALLSARPISFLSLPSCWGARDDPPSSSGVSMGSGSGSSTGTSCLLKQGSLPGVPSPRSYPPGIFSSLPRGVFLPPSSLGRSATLPRQPIEPAVEKRSCDSVVSKIWYPTPTCDGGPHNSGTLHDLFVAIRDSYSKLHGLDLSKAQLSLEDSMCLGETVRISSTMHTLKLEGCSRISEILPSILGASESPCLQMLSVSSQRLNLEDSVIAMCARALSSCTTLRLLSLDGWSFRIEHIQTLSILRAFLSLTSIRELSLSNCRLQTNLIRTDAKETQKFESKSVVVLKLSGAQITLPDLNVLRGPQLLQYIRGFPCLRELDLSSPARSGIDSTHSSPLILDDKCIMQFFNNLHSYFGLLNTLKICNWIIHFDDFSKTLKTIGKAMRNSSISHLKLDGISVLDRPKKQRSEASFIHCFITSLPHLRWLGISLAGKREEQITAIGNAVLDLKGSEIEIKLSESTIEQAKLIAQAISVDGKFDIKVSTFGTSSGILIHAEKCGIKSLTRKSKDKDQYF